MTLNNNVSKANSVAVDAQRCCDEASCPECVRLQIQHDSWRYQAMTLLGAHAMLLKELTSVAMQGSQIIAEAKGLEPAERRLLLQLFALLHFSAPLTERALTSSRSLDVDQHSRI